MNSINHDNNVYTYTVQTVNRYPNIVKRIIEKKYYEEGIITKKEVDRDKSIYVGDIGDENPILYSLRLDNSLIKEIEQWEFEKSYKYSVLFDMPSFSKALIESMVEKKEIIQYESLGESYETLHSEINSLTVPVVCFYDRYAIIKFSIKLKAINVDGLEVKNRYPICAVFYYDEKVLEIRFDSIKNEFGVDKFNYVDSVQEWFDKKTNQNLHAIDCQEFIGPIVSGKQQVIDEFNDNLYVIEQDMILNTGGKATIGIGNDERKIIPFIGELKELMIEEEDLFKQNPKIQELLLAFISNKESLSVYPWVKVGFTKSCNASVKIMFNYDRRHYTLFQHITDAKSANFKRERMDNVTDFITKTRSEFNKSES